MPGLADLTPSAKAMALVTKADAELPRGVAGNGPPRALLVGTAGSANLMDHEGNVLADVPLQRGYNPLSVRRVLPGGTADNMWAPLMRTQNGGAR